MSPTPAILLTDTGAAGGAIASPATATSGKAQAVNSVATESSPFALLVNANQAHSAAVPVRNSSMASASPLPLDGIASTPIPTDSTNGATATAGVTGFTATAAIPRPELATDAGTDLAVEDVIPVTPVAPIARPGNKSTVQVQDAIDPALATATAARPATNPTVTPAATSAHEAIAVATPKAATAATPPIPTVAGSKPIGTGKPVSEAPPSSGTPTLSTPSFGSAGDSLAIAAGPTAVARPTPAAVARPTTVTATPSNTAPHGTHPTSANSGQVPPGAINTTPPNETVAPANVAAPTAPATKTGMNTAIPAAHAVTQAPTQANPVTGQNKPAASDAKTATTGKATATPTTGGTAASPEAVRAPADNVDLTPLRQRGTDTSAIQTASSLAARPASGSQGAAPATPTAGGASQSSSPSASSPNSAMTGNESAAALAATKDALPTAAQTGAPITPLPAAMGDTQAQQAARLDGMSLDAAVQAETDFNLSRMDGRMAAERNGSQLHRFTPHTTTQLAGQITKQVSNGNRVFDIRLDPAELGKVDVRIELRADNRVHAVLTVERPETLNELQRTARDLERSLAEAGLELDEDGLSFQMNDGQDPAGDEDRESGDALPVFTQTNELARRADDELSARPRSAYGFLLSGRTGVDVQV